MTEEKPKYDAGPAPDARLCVVCGIRPAIPGSYGQICGSCLEEAETRAMRAGLYGAPPAYVIDLGEMTLEEALAVIRRVADQYKKSVSPGSISSST